jgi:hypothetical protein
MEEEMGFEKPEEAALASWPETAKARVVGMKIKSDTAVVLVDTEPSHPMHAYCERRGDRWFFVGDSTA